VKTTLDIRDELLARAKRLSKRTGKPLRQLVEEGLQHIMDSQRRTAYELPDRSVGRPGDPDPLVDLSWQDLRGEIYGSRG
jgi:hypothetical protein